MDAVRYAPMGHRGGAGGTRAARFGTVSWDEHTRTSNENIILSVMTEDERGISEIGQIAALPGIDLVSIGPTDFSEYMGIRDPQSPVIRARLEELAAEVKAAGGAKLVHAHEPSRVSRCRRPNSSPWAWATPTLRLLPRRCCSGRCNSGSPTSAPS